MSRREKICWIVAYIVTAILTLLPCHLLAQSQYATISSVSVDTTSERKVTINWSAEPVSDNQVYAIYH